MLQLRTKTNTTILPLYALQKGLMYRKTDYFSFVYFFPSDNPYHKPVPTGETETILMF